MNFQSHKSLIFFNLWMGFVHLGIKKKPIDLPMQNTTFKWNKEFLFTIYIRNKKSPWYNCIIYFACMLTLKIKTAIKFHLIYINHRFYSICNINKKKINCLKLQTLWRNIFGTSILFNNSYNSSSSILDLSSMMISASYSAG